MRRRGKRSLPLFMALVMVLSLVYGSGAAISAENPDASGALAQETAVTEAETRSGTTDDGSNEGQNEANVPESTETAAATENSGGGSSTEGTTESGSGAEATPGSESTGGGNGAANENASGSGSALSEPESGSVNAGTESAGTEAGTEGVTEAGTEKATEALSEDATENVTEEASEESDSEKTASLTEQTIKASGSGASVTLSGRMPEGAKAEAIPVSVEIEGQTVLAAYDITIYDAQGKVFQPEAGSIRVEIADAAVEEAVAQAEDISVYHMEDANASPEEVEKVDAADGSVTFEAEHFSIYVVTTPDEPHYTHTYIFYDEDGSELSRQILSVGETLLQPKTPEKQGKIFAGWYTAQSGGDLFKDFNKDEGQLEKSKETKLYARYKNAYYVFYKAGNDAGSRVFYTQTYDEPGEKILTEDVPFQTADSDQALIGWSTSANADSPDADLKIPEEGGDVTLYPVVKAAHWITYDSQGGSVLEPVYVLSGEVSQEPTAPTRAGYTFGGWYTNEGCTDEYTFGNPLADNITLYAKWEPGSASYTVVYWQENPDDDGYSYKESKQQSGTTGTMTNVVPDSNRYEGFTLNTKKTVQQTIQGDGSSVVNVYYDRNEYEIKFYEYKQASWPQRGSWQVIEELTITAKYGQNISYLWPSRRTDLSTTYPSNWKVTENGTTMQAGIDVMPLGGDEFYKREESGNYTYKLNYYLEDLQGNYVLDHTDTFKYDGRLTTSQEDYYAIKGFSVNMKKSPAVGSAGESEGYFGKKFDFYYDRNTYRIDFVVGGKTDKSEQYLYEADISGAGYKPTAPEGQEDYVFAGWYDNAEGYGEPYDFEGKTMPAANMVLYAKWVLPEYTVSFDLNGAEKENLPETYAAQEVEKGGTAQKPEDPVRAGYTFAGWTKDGKPFNFNTQVTDDITLTAQWISNAEYTLTYISGDGNGDDVVDSGKYAEGAEAKVGSVPEAWTAPEGSTGFLYWEDMDGNIYYPGDSLKFPAADLELTAVWGDARTTALTYNFNGGTYTDDAGVTYDKLTVTINTPNSEYAIENYTPTRTGYKFAGWTVASDGSGDILQAGEKIQVDTLEPESNVLYAKWEQVFTVTVQKIVSGNMGDTSSGKEYSFTYEVAKDGAEKVTGNLSIAHDGSATITDIAEGSTVTITENEAGADGYTTYVRIGENGQEDKKSAVSLDNVTENKTVTFINKKDIAPPTGVTERVLPAVLLVVLAVLGGAYLLMVRRRRQMW